MDNLGFLGVTHTLRVPKERVPKLLAGEPFSANLKIFAKRTIKQIHNIQNNLPATKQVQDMYDITQRRKGIYETK